MMSDNFAEIERWAQSLTVEERARLAESLLESLHEPPLLDVETSWQHEIAERVAAYDRGELQSYAAEDVFAEARHIAQ